MSFLASLLIKRVLLQNCQKALAQYFCSKILRKKALGLSS